ncbi:MAG: hypothetical protein SVU32_03565 [Candidatus Nanohaloarchaea archaeon]|nr:hypothetical protein [Candidatus Nanohaloarchaea archaeon]
MPGKGSDRAAVLISYDTRKDRFDSLYDRNKFYRGLFGYKQKVRENDKVYRYEKEGLIDRIPSIKVEDSVIIIARENLARLEEYFDKWGDKVEYKTYKVILDKEDWKKVRPSSEAHR